MSKLEEICRQVRINILRMIEGAGSGHPGGSLSCVEILVALYFHQMKKGDIFILSKGHAAPAFYAVLAEKGLIAKKELKTLRKLGSCLQGHTSSKYLPQVEFSAGILGQGLSFACGSASAINSQHYILLSDGEMQCGKIWAAAQVASHLKLDNLCAIVDYNGCQIDGRINEIRNIEPLREKWESFGWKVFETNGHNLQNLIELFNDSAKVSKKSKMPAVIIAHTVKGKGVSFMEDNNKFHGKPPAKEELSQALKELKGKLWRN